MAIYTERVVMVNKDTAKMDNDIYIYKGNRNICIQFKIIDSQFKFRDVNLVDKFSPSHGYVTLINPEGEQIATGKAEIENATLKLTVTSGMIDEDTEVGDYTIVIDLYDEVGDSLLTIPPIYNQLHVLKRVTDVQDIPDEVRFVYENDGNLQTVNIDAYVEGAEIKTINKMPLADTAARKDIEAIKTAYSGVSNDFDQLEKNVNSTIAALDARIDLDMDNLADYKEEVNTQIKDIEKKFDYVTFEDFGAVGDGITDDSNAIQLALNSKKRILCKRNKKYLNSKVLIADYDVNIDGNDSEFINFIMHININNDGNDWRVSFAEPKATLKNITFIRNDSSNYCLLLGCGIYLKNIHIKKYNNFVRRVDRYIDYFVFENGTISGKVGTDYSLKINGMGDYIYIKGIHMGIDEANMRLLQTNVCNAVRVENIFHGEFEFSNCTVLFENCHFEKLLLNNNQSKIQFLSCYFWVKCMPTYNAMNNFQSCTFMCNNQTYAPFDISKIKGQNNLLVFNSTEINFDTRMEIDKLNKEVGKVSWSGDLVSSSNGNFGLTNSSVTMPTGELKYTLFQSVSKDTINCGDYANSSKEITVNTTQNKAYYFNVSSRYNNCFIHCYKEVNGLILKAVTVVAENGMLIDTGSEINGVPWVRVDSIPTVKGNFAIYFGNNLYLIDDYNNFNGNKCTVLDRNTGTIKWINS